MYCTKCGKHLTKKSKFCTLCGQKLNITSTAELKSKKGISLKNPFFILWVLTIFLFFISVGLLVEPTSSNPTWKPSLLSILFIVNFWLGVAAFLTMIITTVARTKVGTKRFHKFIFAAMVIFGLLYSSTVAIEGYSKGNLNNLLPSSLQINNKQSTSNKVEGSKASQVPQRSASNSTPTTAPTLKPVINSNPLVNCGPGQYSGQYVKDKQSNCKNYVDCGLSNNVWTMMLKSECDKKQAEPVTKNNTTNTNTYNPLPTLITYPPCTVYYPVSKSSQTYYYIPPDQCQKWKEDALSILNQTQTLIPTYTPIPIVDNHAANSSCKYSASQWYNTQVQNANNLFGDSSATQAMQQVALSTYNSMVSDCNNKYPI